MSKYLKTLHVINIFFSLSYLKGHFKHFNSKGHKQHIICSPDERLNQLSKIENFEYLEIPIKRSISPFSDIYSIYRTYHYIKKNNINLVFGHTPKGALIGMISSFLAGSKKRVYFRHGLVYETMFGIKKTIFKYIEKITSYLATDVIVVSEYLYKKSINDKISKKNKLILLGKGTANGIDTKKKFNRDNLTLTTLYKIKNELNINDSDYVIGYCGRIVKDKGISDLVEAFLKLKKTNSKYKLLLIGDYEDKDPLPQKIIYEINNNPDIIKTGFIFKNIEYYYSLMDVFVLPSYREGFGMSIIEASAMEIPVISNKFTGSQSAILDKVTGYLIEINTTNIVNAILNTKQNPKLGKNGRKFVIENFDNKIIWNFLEEKIYKS